MTRDELQEKLYQLDDAYHYHVEQLDRICEETKRITKELDYENNSSD